MYVIAVVGTPTTGSARPVPLKVRLGGTRVARANRVWPIMCPTLTAAFLALSQLARHAAVRFVQTDSGNHLGVAAQKIAAIAVR